MLAIGLHAQHERSDNHKMLMRIEICWLLGILLFSGSLYGLALGGPQWLGPVTPLGGIFLLAGWGGVMGYAIKSPKTNPS